MPTERPHHIRSFKPRRGRVTPGQQRALDALWPVWGVEPASRPLDPRTLFGRQAPWVLEIGFGMGEATAAMAAADPDRDILAVDVHTPGVGALLAEVEARGLHNVRVAVADAVELLRDGVRPGALDEVRAFFPDPWPKSRHHKRRLVNAPFVALVASRLAPGGRLHLATDWADYAAVMLDVVRGCPDLVVPADGFSPRPMSRPLTRFERQGLAKGHVVHDLIAVRR